MSDIWNIFKEFFSPIYRFTTNKMYIQVAVIASAEFDARKIKNLYKTPKTKAKSQSIAIFIINHSLNPIDISSAGIEFKSGKQQEIFDFHLPVRVEARNRHAFTLKSETVEMLRKEGLDNIKYFYVEDPLFQRFKGKLSKAALENMRSSVYFESGRLYSEPESNKYSKS